MEKPSLSAYTDFREYLKDYFSYRRHLTSKDLRPYSYSDFSAAADIKSPNYLKMIIEGQRNLSPDMAKKFARALKLDKNETTEFEVLVLYGQEKDPLNRNKFVKKLSEIRSANALDQGSIDESTWEKVPSWLSWVLYAMIDQEGIVFDPAVLKKHLRNATNEKQIQIALDKLVQGNDVTIDDNKVAHRSSKMISNADKISPELIRKLQSELIYLGLESLYRDDPKEREISGFTLAMTAEEYSWVRHELRKVRKEIQAKLMMAREKQPGKKVYQMNIQLFPLTRETEAQGGLEKSSESQGTGEKDA
ncbi:MAG: TIGR02147 family protein [Bdellovibrionales bacterium]|nr:TIGR02147 family protein [Bdellovibrionales bacterium]